MNNNAHNQLSEEEKRDLAAQLRSLAIGLRIDLKYGEGAALVAREGLPFPAYESYPKNADEEHRWKTVYFLDGFDLSWERMHQLSTWPMMEDGRLQALLGINPELERGSDPPESVIEASGYEDVSLDNAPQTGEEWRYINQRVRITRKATLEHCLRTLWDLERLRFEELCAMNAELQPAEKIESLQSEIKNKEDQIEAIRIKELTRQEGNALGGRNRADNYIAFYDNKLKPEIYKYLWENPRINFTPALERVCRDLGASDSGAKKNIKKADVVDDKLAERMREARKG